MKKLIIAIALLVAIADAQFLWTIKMGNRQIGLYPSSSACFDALRQWQAQGGWGFCAVAD